MKEQEKDAEKLDVNGLKDALEDADPLSETHSEKGKTSTDTSSGEKTGLKEPSVAPHTSMPKEQEKDNDSESDPHMEQLISMFPDLHKATISDILRAKKGNVEAGMYKAISQSAIPLLLQISDPESNPTPATRYDTIQSSPYYANYTSPSSLLQNQNQDQMRHGDWDPTQLHYHPRVRHPRPSTHVQMQEPQYHTTNPWPGPEEARQWQENFNRFTEVGLAKMGSTFSSLRQKAETALRNHDIQNRISKYRGRGGFNATAFFRPDMTYQTSSGGWEQGTEMHRPMYDNDPPHVIDEDIDKLVNPRTPSGIPSQKEREKDSEPVPILPPRPPAKTPKPSWGQRYAGKSASTTAETKDQAVSKGSSPSKEKNGKEEVTKDKNKKDEKAEATPNEKPDVDKSTPSKESNEKEVKKEAPSTKDTEPAADDDEYIDNPFDDED